jgi:RNA polymerase-binding transcription factor DksA
MSKKPAKKSAPRKPARKSVKKHSPSKPKPVSKKSVKPVPKKSTASAKSAPKPAAKSAPATKKSPAPAAKAPAKSAPAPKPAAGKETTARASLRSRILAQSRAKAHPRPAEFSLDDALIAAKAAASAESTAKAAAATAAVKSAKAAALAAKAAARPAQPNHIKAASLADILGFNPRKAAPSPEDDSSIPEKFRRYYRLLLDLRRHLTGQIDQHSEDTLRRSSKDDAGDLSSYGQHMADAGTDTFDRDFALSMVASEQEALTEVEAAIQRIKAGTYGVCEVTQKPIAKERLVAVPFTRYSAEALKHIEKNRLRTRTQAGLGSESDDHGPMADDSGGE